MEAPSLFATGSFKPLFVKPATLFFMGLLTATSGPAQLAGPWAPGSLDSSFDPTRGGQLIGPASALGSVTTLVRQPDGKLLVGGQFGGYNGRLRRHLVRLLPNGALDEGFDPGLGFDGCAYSAALQTNGQVLVGGSFSLVHTNSCSSLVRLNPDGSLDASFRPLLTSYGSPGLVRAIVVQPDGNILVGGSFCEVDGIARTNVARLHQDGSLDESFVPASGAPDWYQGVVNLAVMADGKVLVGGRLLGTRKLLCRLNSDGSLDSSFATDLTGYELVQFAVRSDGKIYAAGPFDLEAPGWYYSRLVLVNSDGMVDSSFAVNLANTGFYCFAALAVQPDDCLLVAGWFQSVNGVPRNQIARLTPEGRLDISFDPGDSLGSWVPPTEARSMLIEPDGHIWLGGSVPLNNGHRSPLVRLLPSGRLDNDFYAAAGDLSLAGHEVAIRALATLADGRAYIGGSFASYNNHPRTNLARILPDGSLDTSFSPAWTNQFEVGVLALQPDAKVLASGPSGLARFNPDGSLDPGFKFHLQEDLGMRLGCLALQADGRIILGGEFAGGLARLDPDGSLDRTFSPPNLPAYDGDAVNAVAVQPDGKILFGGNGAIGFQRLHPDGSVDTTFNYSAQAGFAIRRILVQPDCTILVAGRPCLWVDQQMVCLVRLRPDGSLDPTFRAPVGESVEALAVAPDGWLLAAMADLSTGEPARICKLDAYGTLDPKFLAHLGPVYGQSLVSDILVQPDGQVLIAGSLTSINGIPTDALARLNNQLASGLGWTTRHAPLVFVPGEPLTVTLTTAPPASATSYAVEDQPPAGWIVSDISSGGRFDALARKVRWGPFFDNLSRTLTYRVTPPPTANGPASITGRSSAEGVSVLIEGSRELNESCQLSVGTQFISGQFHFAFKGRVGARVAFDTSTDLITWTPWTTVSNAQGVVALIRPIQSDTSQQFLRARLLQ